MKPAPLLLAASLICNIALVTVALSKRPLPATSAKKITLSQTASANATPQVRIKTALANGDMRELLAILHAEGFPMDALRAIARDRITKEFASRRAALMIPPAPYWRYSEGDLSNRRERVDPKRFAEYRALQEEEQKALADLLGDIPREITPYDRRNYGDLSPEKITKLSTIQNDYYYLRAALYDESKLIRFPDDKARIELLDKEQRADIEKLLTPEELADYDLRRSPTASKVQDQLKFFLASEAEYKAIYAIQQQFDKQHEGIALSAEETKLLREAQIQAVLTPERFADYKITTSGSYETVRELVNSLSLPPATIAQVIGLQIDVTNKADLIRRDATLSPDQRNAQIAALAQDATANLTASLGQEGFNNYKRIPGGSWLQKLTPQAPKPAR